MNNNQTVSREEYRRLENRVTCILQQRWSANEISQWVGMLQGKQQAVACAILRRRYPRPTSLALPAITTEVPNPYQAKARRPSVPVLTTDGCPAGRRHIVDKLTPVAAEQLNPMYKPALHQVVADHRS